MRREMCATLLTKDICNRCRLRHPLETPDRAGDTSQVRRQLAPIVVIFLKKGNRGWKDSFVTIAIKTAASNIEGMGQRMESDE